MEVTKFAVSLLESFTGGATVNYDEREVERLADLFPAFQQVILYMNWVFVGIFVLFVALRIHMILLRLKVTQEREEFKKGLSQDVSSWAFNGALLTPITGVLSGIQLILVIGLLCAVMLTKTVATLFYVGNGGFTLLESVQAEAEPAMVEHAQNNVAYHLCSINSKDKVVKEVMSLVGTDYSKLEEDPYFQCINSDDEIQPRKDYIRSPEDYFSSSDYPSLATFEANYDIGLERRLHLCYEEIGTQSEYSTLSAPNDCGDVILRAPVGESEDPESSTVLSVLEGVFLSDQYQTPLLEQAYLMYEYDCRQDGSSDSTKCFSQTAGNSSLIYDFEENEQTEENEFMELPFGMGEVTKRDLISRFELLAEEIKLHIGSNIQSVSSAFLNEFTSSSESDVTELLALDKEVEKIKNQIERGVWLSSVAFVSDIGHSIDKEIINKVTEHSYSVKSSSYVEYKTNTALSLLPYADIALDGDTTGEFARSKVTSIIVPTFDIYKSYKQCWENSIFCDRISINPFAQIVDVGVKSFDSAVSTGVIAILVRNIANATRTFNSTRFAKKLSSASDSAAKASKIPLIDMFITIQFVYMLFGAILALYIPLIPVYILLSKLISWAKDLIGVTIGLQLDLATSPIGEHENRMLSNEVRKAFSSLFVLGAHFLFIGIGVMMCFILFSFYMALNAVVVGLVLDIFGIAQVSSLMESMVAALITDTLMVFIFYVQAKSAASMIKKVPDALAEQFEVQIDRDETVLQKFESIVKGQLLPEIKRYMG